jgi:hypothetical protein
MIRYRHFVYFVPFVCGVDQVMIPGPESRPALIFLKAPPLTIVSGLYFVQF